MVRLLIPLLLLLPCSCAKQLAELVPFPCASDRSCPEGLACNDSLCSAARLDSPCGPGTDCSTAGKDARCEAGICAVSCSATLPCPAGRICSNDPSIGAGVCLLDCTEADRQKCPAALSCIALPYAGKKGCVGSGGSVENKLDARCDADGDCGPAGTQLRCAFGACSLPCDKGLPCSEGHVCTSPGGPGSCLVDCSTGIKCQAGLACHDLWFDGRKACMSPTREMPACKSVVASETFVCTEQCGLFANNFSCDSQSSMFCPITATCDVAKKVCNCDLTTSAPTTCAGAKCDASNNFCTGSAWWCKPTKLDQGCSSVSPNLDVVCECVGGNWAERNCGVINTCEERCRNGCDFSKQNCRDKATPKCNPAGGKWGTQACEPLIGTKKAGQACQFGTDPAYPGADDCDVGLKCSVDTAPAGSVGVCRKLCATDSDCTSPELCMGGPIDGSYGFCLPTCTPFGAGCPSGQKCMISKLDNLAGACFRAGTQEIGWPCYFDAECKDDLLCYQGSCIQLCDAQHACRQGPKLQPVPACKAFKTSPNPTGLGLCLFNQ